MAWYCSGSSNSEMIENLYRTGLIKNERVKDAMLQVRALQPRHGPKCQQHRPAAQNLPDGASIFHSWVYVRYSDPATPG